MLPTFGYAHGDHWSDFKATGDTDNDSRVSWDFEELKDGQLPLGWQAEKLNEQDNETLWITRNDDTMASPTMVLAITATPSGNGNNFNMCWTDRVKFQDGAIELNIKKDSGEIDQGGGIIWRVQDRDNYYLTRWNPLENNLRLYRVVQGRREQLASCEVPDDQGTWHSLRIEQMGSEIKCFFDTGDTLFLQDSTFPQAGGVGVWTKADAHTSFDDIDVQGWAPDKSPAHDPR